MRDVKKMRVTNKLERHLSVEEKKHMYQVCDDDFRSQNYLVRSKKDYNVFTMENMHI